ncbi:unnamed protein product [Owenia fusiformis]|uniref:MACPF domain-containing protein n=1 Tax=Owenia fusiformis TaxID=6347 RepID=A0A8S4PUC7_OWEFU|nr:unnamed protein product [Owenia fusiformis]
MGNTYRYKPTLACVVSALMLCVWCNGQLSNAAPSGNQKKYNGQDVCQSGEDHCKDANGESFTFNASPQRKVPEGDYRNCADSNGKIPQRLEALPGGAWDNLRNLDMGLVGKRNYSKCLTTEDENYLIPDGTFVIPLKKSNLETFAEVIEHWSNYTSMTSSSINADAHVLSFISGSFSSTHQRTKMHQYNEKSMTTRVQMRHLLYTVKLSMDIELERALQNRVLDIIGYLQDNRTNEAVYQTQLLVRDYGTHVITSVDVGAVLAQEDQIKRSFVYDHQNERSSIKASASADFFGKVGFSVGGGSASSEAMDKSYRSSRTFSRVITHGGPPFMSNFTLNDWERGLVNSLVAIDKAGDPLHYFITPDRFPGIPIPSVDRAAALIEQSIDRYYRINTRYGCTSMDSPNFSFEANLEDGSCELPLTNFTFGGVFQKCALMQQRSAGDICPELVQKNPLTGDFSCPPQYSEVLLHTGVKTKGEMRNECNDRCHDCGFLGLSTCCDRVCANVHYSTQAEYRTYWCVATGHVNVDSGFLFGGIYTTTSQNPLTKSEKCPVKFFPLKLGNGGCICVSDDYELGFRFSVPFAGLFSCTAGNPLVLSGNIVSKRSVDAPRSMMTYLSDAGPASWPHRCPPGYSQHMASIDDGCEIEYCVKVNALSTQGLTPIKRPPFIDPPYVNPNYTDTMMIIGPAGKAWEKNKSQEWRIVTEADAYKDYQKSSGSSEPLSGGAIAGKAIGVVVFVALVVIVIVLATKGRCTSCKRSGHSELRDDDHTPVMSAQGNTQQGTSRGGLYGATQDGATNANNQDPEA